MNNEEKSTVYSSNAMVNILKPGARIAKNKEFLCPLSVKNLAQTSYF